MSQVAHFRVIDLETCGFLDEMPAAVQADPCQGIVEIGYTDVKAEFNDAGRFVTATIEKPGFLLYNPPGGIPPVSRAIHHITPQMVRDLPACRAGDVQLVQNGAPAPYALVAHNVAFEREWMGRYIPEARWVCTLKVWAQLEPNWPAHSNQACRYLLGQELDVRWADPPHRAGPDSWVTANHFVEALRRTSVRQMVEWTKQPRLLTTCPFGEHRGKAWAEVPEDYLRWYVNKASQQDPDTLHWVKKALEDRAAMRAQPDLAASDY